MKEDIVQKAVDISIGAVVSAKEALDKLASELHERGRAARGKGGSFAAEVRDKGRNEKEALLKLADEELQRILTKAGIASAKDIAHLDERLAAVEARLTALEHATAPPVEG